MTEQINGDKSATVSPSGSAAGAGPAPARAAAVAPLSTAALLAAMQGSAPNISNLFFSPGKAPMVEINGRLAAVGARALAPDETRQGHEPCKVVRTFYFA